MIQTCYVLTFFPYFQKWHFLYWKRKRCRETPKNFIWAMKQKWLYSLTYKNCTTNIWPNCKISPEYQMDCCLSHKNFVEGHSWKVPKFNKNSVTRSGWFFVSFFSYFCCKAIYWIAKLLGWQCQVCKIPKSIEADDLLSEKTTVRILKNSNHLLICKECRATIYQFICPTVNQKRQCRDPGSNRGPLDLQSNALPTELSRHSYKDSPTNVKCI